jgi:peptidoglycan DL-endopeptidase CwlO
MKIILHVIAIWLIIFAIIKIDMQATNVKKFIKNQKPIIVESSPIPYDYLGEYKITWYCTGKITASGNKVNHQITGAGDLKQFKFNDIVYIEGLSQPVVIHDTGGLIKGNRIDVYIDDCDLAIKNGVKTRKVYKLGE